MSPPNNPNLGPGLRPSGITKLTNCLVLRDDALVWDDIWISSTTGKIVDAQSAFYDDLLVPDTVVDLQGRIVCPGFIDVQLNGAFGFNFSCLVDDYPDRLSELNKKLVKTGVTSYLPTVTSQTSHLYKKVRVGVTTGLDPFHTY
jgi:N-acetylglucosamine-6-phosphate deacetylase